MKEIVTLSSYENEDIWEINKLFLDEFVYRNTGYPVKLIASNSNWRGQTGYAEAHNVDELVNKIFSFGNDEVVFKEDETDGYYFRTSSHDVPMGFNIYMEKEDDNVV